MEAARRGDEALAASDPATAISHFTEALSSSPDSPVYYLKRSKAYHRKANYEDALVDAELAVVAAVKRGKRELIAEGQMRRGVTLAAMDRIQDAHVCFEQAHKYDYKGKDLAIHEARLKNKRKGLAWSDAKMQKNVEDMPTRELPGTAPTAKHKSSAKAETPATQDAAKTDGIPATNVTVKPGTAPTPIGSSVGSTTPAASIRHEWYQNNETVFVTLFAKAIPKDTATVNIQATSLDISFPLTSGSDYSFSLDPLFGDIKTDDAKSKIFGTKIEVTLPKAVPGVKWSSLEGSASHSGSAATATPIQSPSSTATASKSSTGPSNPYSSRGGQQKNWDKIVDSYHKNPAGKNGKDGSDAAAGDDDVVRIGDDDEEDGDSPDYFFKKLFKGATPEQQRAMMKSYQESNGTSLSTNWAEVSAGRVEVKPPEGMEEKKYST